MPSEREAVLYDSLTSKAARLFSASKFLEASRLWWSVFELLRPRLRNEEGASVAALSATGHDVVCIEAKPSSTSLDHAGAISIYRSAIGYVRSPGLAWTNDDCRRAAAAAWYNMALAHHLHGMSDANNSSSIKTALKAYGVARSLLASVARGRDARSLPEDVKLLALAATNNRGHVLSSLHEAAAAGESWLHIRSLVSRTVLTAQTLHFFASAAAYPAEDGVPALPAPAA
jgi:hypothetical protein